MNILAQVDPETLKLVSIPAILTATALIVSTLKNSLANVAWFNKVPIVAYVLVVAGALTALANLVLHTLPGSFSQLLTDAVLAALGSKGLFSVVTGSSLQSLGDTANK